MQRNDIRFIVGILVFVYVTLGTIIISYLYYPSNIIFSTIGDKFLFVLSLFVLPGNLLGFAVGFGIRWDGSYLFWPVIIAQLITLVAHLFLADYIVRRIFRFRDRKRQK